MKQIQKKNQELFDCWQAMCSDCLGQWYGKHRANSALATGDAKAHNNAHPGHTASAVHSCAFPPSDRP
ncbi:hypothetical protein COJ51_02210 [Bacillus thuringiensis]|uniref:hypothetical protein n=1 Tax=Bacillus thuringiensis TaxID=1428 RepID=UPI000BF84347|nr:hypothetical protein [Bacillus thuringiensis]PFN11077.1 hypothetical protein COJ51_02210 [Bacillus thuringiensis]